MLILFWIKTSKSFIRQWLIWNLCVGTHMSVQTLRFKLLKLFSLGNLSLLEHSSCIYVFKRWNVRRRSSGRLILDIHWCQSYVYYWYPYKLATTKMKSFVAREEHLLVASPGKIKIRWCFDLSTWNQRTMPVLVGGLYLYMDFFIYSLLPLSPSYLDLFKREVIAIFDGFLVKLKKQ